MKKPPIDKKAFGKRLAEAREAARLTQAQLGDAAGYTQQSIQGMENGAVGRPGKIIEIAEAVNSTVDWLLYGVTGERGAANVAALTTGRKSSRADETISKNARMGGPVDGFGSVPIRGQSMGGKEGALLFSGHVDMGNILAPPALANVPGAYAVYIVGNSMFPRFKDGHVAFVHPHQRVVKGDDCVVQIENLESGELYGWVKEFVSDDDTTLKVCQFNPRKTISFKRTKKQNVISVHRIIMSGPV